MRRCICHTNLGNNAKFHNYSRQIALIQSWAFCETVQKIFNDKRQICSSASSGRVFERTLTELRFNIIKNLLCLFFIQWFYNDV